MRFGKKLFVKLRSKFFLQLILGQKRKQFVTNYNKNSWFLLEQFNQKKCFYPLFLSLYLDLWLFYFLWTLFVFKNQSHFIFCLIFCFGLSKHPFPFQFYAFSVFDSSFSRFMTQFTIFYFLWPLLPFKNKPNGNYLRNFFIFPKGDTFFVQIFFQKSINLV